MATKQKNYGDHDMLMDLLKAQTEGKSFGKGGWEVKEKA